jgi:putative transposase
MRLDGTVSDSYDNAMAESADGAYETELVWRHKPFADLAELELATFRWASWRNSKRLHQSLGYRTLEQIETEYYTNQAVQAASL